MEIQRSFETCVNKIMELLKSADPDPWLIERSKKPPKIEIEQGSEIDPSDNIFLGIKIEDHRILIPRVSDEIMEPFLYKTAFDWVLLPHLQILPDPARQFSFLLPWFFLKKSNMNLIAWEILAKKVFKTPVNHGNDPEFSLDYLIWTYQQDDVLLFSDFYACLQELAKKHMQMKLDQVPLEMFLEEFFTQIFSIRELNETEKQIIIRAIELGDANPKRLKNELELAPSTAYYTISRCFKKLHLMENKILKLYCLDLEPIILFFPGIPEEDGSLIEQHFRASPYLYNFGRFSTQENEQTSRDEITLILQLWFPGRFTHKLRTMLSTFSKERRYNGFHWFRYDRVEHGYSLQKYGINVNIHRTFNYRGGVIPKIIQLISGDWSLIGYRLGHRPTPTLDNIARVTGIKKSRLFAAEKRLFPEIIAGNYINISIDHILPVKEFRLLLKNPDPSELQYLRDRFPEHYFYFDVNNREMLTLLMIPTELSQEIEEFVTERETRVILSGYNLGQTYSYMFKLADLENEYDYEHNTWKDPFRVAKHWSWIH